MSETTGQRVRLARLSLRYSQAELAGILGYRQAWVSKIELDQRNLLVETAKRLAFVLGVKWQDLYPQGVPLPQIPARELWDG